MLELQIGCLPAEIENLPATCAVDQSLVVPYMEAVRQDEQLEMVGNSVAVLKNMGEQIGNELETQNQMLDEFADEIDQTQSKLDSTLLRMEKVLRLAGDKKQMCVIFSLIILLVGVVLLFAFTL